MNDPSVVSTRAAVAALGITLAWCGVGRGEPAKAARDKPAVAIEVTAPRDKGAIPPETVVEFEGRVSVSKGSAAPTVLVIYMTKGKVQFASVGLRVGEDGKYGSYLKKDDSTFRFRFKVKTPPLPGTYQVRVEGLDADTQGKVTRVESPKTTVRVNP